jgi:hypothetical protein
MNQEITPLESLHRELFVCIRSAARIPFLNYIGTQLIAQNDYAGVNKIKSEITELYGQIRNAQEQVNFLLAEHNANQPFKKEILVFNRFINELNTKNHQLPLPFHRSYWVIPGLLLAGEIPSALKDEERTQKIVGILKSGVQTVINLTEKREANFLEKQLVDYSDELNSLAKQENLPLRIERFAICDLDIPSVEFMHTILQFMKSEICNNNTVYVHCWGGLGRTGTVIGCFLIQHGICQPDEVLNFIEYLKKDTDIFRRDSPETSEQRKFLLNWQSEKCNN